ncbi:hypothetical protein D1AOALGA4SA_5484 [Olavius algarvensis Delta 1 endosymbiont]|nr:hypothetical protein D1AOALGA4SA_5484 [Olavius algarvensis Delta 1 endosymbiont]
MIKYPATLSSICGAGAQLSWLYAWVSFLLISFYQRIYPLPEAIGAFCLAAYIASFCRRRRWRVIQVIGVHLALGAGTGLWVVHDFYYRMQPWWSRGWLNDFFSLPRDHLEWFLLFLVVGSTVWIWSAGVRFAHRARSYTAACSRFDRGVIAFFALFLVKLTLQTRMGVEFHDSGTILTIFPFFMFSLMEVGLARSRGNDQGKAYLAGYSAVGVLASFTVGALIIGTAAVMLFLPYLKMASVAGYGIVQKAAAPFGSLAVAVIKFIFGHADWDSTISDFASSMPAVEAVEASPWMLMVQNLMMWGGWILLIAVGTIIAGVVLWYAYRWLFLKRVGAEPIEDPLSLLLWWRQLKAFLIACSLWVMRANARQTALQFFTALRRWGRHSGFRQKPNETPLEYGRRLSQQFPLLKTEITLIIDMLHREVYGQTSLNPQQLSNIRQSWKRLHSPGRWFMRLKAVMANKS